MGNLGLRLARMSALKKVFDGYIEDTITDEQVQRILDPILKLIREGAFDRPRRFFRIGDSKRRGLLDKYKNKTMDL